MGVSTGERFAAVEERIGNLETKIDTFDERLDAKLDACMQRMTSEIASLAAKFQNKEQATPNQGENSVNRVEDVGNGCGFKEGVETGCGSKDVDSRNTKNWTKKVELPSFEGTDPLGWLGRAENFFHLQRIEEAEKLHLAFVCMEGNASHWYQFWVNKTINPTWDGFAQALLRRYGEGYRGDIFERLASIRQEHGVHQYIQEFELLAAQAKATPERQLLGYFLAGLKPNIRSQVRPHEPSELIRAMEVASCVEEATGEGKQSEMGTIRNQGMRLAGGSTTGQNGSRNITVGSQRIAEDIVTSGSTTGCSATTTPKEKGETNDRNSSFKRGGIRFLTHAEQERRRARGLCFTCNRNFGPGHRCPEGNLSVMFLSEDEMVGPAGEDEGEETTRVNLGSMSAYCL